MKKIIESISLLDVVKNHTTLKNFANAKCYSGTCPICNAKGFTFFIDEENQTYQCLSCSSSGNVVSFVADFNDISEVEAVEKLAKETGIPYSAPVVKKEKALYDIYKDTAQYYKVILEKYSKHGKEYKEKRELTDATVAKFALGFSPTTKGKLFEFLSKKYPVDLIERSKLCIKDESGKWYDRFQGRFMFPIFDSENRVVGFGGRVLGDEKPKYLNSPEGEIFEKRNILYGFNFAKKSNKKYIILCEGFMDVIALHQAGFDTAVASLGTAFTQEQCEIIKDFTNTVFLSYDNDAAGIKAAIRAVPMLLDANVSVKVIDKADTKDPDEFIKKYGAKAFEEKLNTATDAEKWLLNVSKDILSEKEYWEMALSFFERKITRKENGR